MENLKFTSMNSKTVLGISLVAIFAISMSVPAFAGGHPSYANVVSSSITPNPSGNVLTFSATAGGNIPHVPDAFINSVPVFGYAWVETFPPVTPTDAVIVTIHPLAGRDSTQDPDLWHPHNAILDANACVIGLTGVTSPNIQGGVAVNGDTINVKLRANQVTVNQNTVSAVAAFQVNAVGIGVCPATGLQVQVLG
jgi:hypothetical protein